MRTCKIIYGFGLLCGSFWGSSVFGTSTQKVPHRRFWVACAGGEGLPSGFQDYSRFSGGELKDVMRVFGHLWVG